MLLSLAEMGSPDGAVEEEVHTPCAPQESRAASQPESFSQYRPWQKQFMQVATRLVSTTKHFHMNVRHRCPSLSLMDADVGSNVAYAATRQCNVRCQAAIVASLMLLVLYPIAFNVTTHVEEPEMGSGVDNGHVEGWYKVVHRTQSTVMTQPPGM